MADETIVQTISLPGASLNQKLTYSPSKAQFIKARDERLERMKKNDFSAFQSPMGDPTVTIETTATKGVAWRGVGLESGRTYSCTYTASDDALWMYEGEMADTGGDKKFKKCSY
jgi:hypothetical protein